jgi:hypothetical protein
LEMVQWLVTGAGVNVWHFMANEVGITLTSTHTHIHTHTHTHTHTQTSTHAHWVVVAQVTGDSALVIACRNGHLRVAQWLAAHFQLDESDPRANDVSLCLCLCLCLCL